MELKWVKAHAGDEGNELADRAAKAVVNVQIDEFGRGKAGASNMVKK